MPNSGIVVADLDFQQGGRVEIEGRFPELARGSFRRTLVALERRRPCGRPAATAANRERRPKMSNRLHPCGEPRGAASEISAATAKARSLRASALAHECSRRSCGARSRHERCARQPRPPRRRPQPPGRAGPRPRADRGGERCACMISPDRAGSLSASSIEAAHDRRLLDQAGGIAGIAAVDRRARCRAPGSRSRAGLPPVCARAPLRRGEPHPRCRSPTGSPQATRSSLRYLLGRASFDLIERSLGDLGVSPRSTSSRI